MPLSESSLIIGFTSLPSSTKSHGPAMVQYDPRIVSTRAKTALGSPPVSVFQSVQLGHRTFTAVTRFKSRRGRHHSRIKHHHAATMLRGDGCCACVPLCALPVS